MISKGSHLRDQPAEQRTSLTNELLNISPSLSCLLLLLLYLFISVFYLSFLYFFICFHSFLFFVFDHHCACMCVLYFFHLLSGLLKILPKIYSSLFLSLKKNLLYVSCCLFSLLSCLLFDMCFSGPLKQCGLILHYTVSQQHHPVQTSLSAYT